MPDNIASKKTVLRKERRVRHNSKGKTKKYVFLSISLIIAFLITLSLFLPSITSTSNQPNQGGSNRASYKSGVGTPQTLMESAKHKDGIDIEYNTIPASSGDHWSIWAKCGFYTEEQKEENTVHNLEHGNIILYHNLSQASQIQTLKGITDELNNSKDWLIVSPLEKLPTGKISMVAWGVIQTFDSMDKSGITKFFETYKGNIFSEETRGIGRGLPCTGTPTTMSK